MKKKNYYTKKDTHLMAVLEKYSVCKPEKPKSP